RPLVPQLLAGRFPLAPYDAGLAPTRADQEARHMNESYITLQGWVGGAVDIRDVGETQCASFRVGSTPRYNRNGTWVDGQTSWYTVNCWRGLAKNVHESIRRGDAVVVH